MKFKLTSNYIPTGDQPQAIEKLVAHFNAGAKHQTLLGVTGSGKTFTIANMIQQTQMPTLVISPNKTLAAQLYQEFRDFFPDNAVHYFVSYYDYYQPEAYIPRTDTYIEKDAKINQQIDSLRHASTASVLSRHDCIIVASVSCIYGVGDPEAYDRASLDLSLGQATSRQALAASLVKLQYIRNSLDPRQGHFRARENRIEIYLPSGEEAVDIEIDRGRIIAIERRRVELGYEGALSLDRMRIFPAKHFVTPQHSIGLAVTNIKNELNERLTQLRAGQKVLEEARIKQRTEFDMEMLQSTGYVNGIENYSRQLEFREPGSPPHTLIDYFRHAYGENFLTVIDESHVTIPQIRGMYFGDKSRKQVLVDYGFRLPSAMDNRPLTFDEFSKKVPTLTYVSATPAPYELQKSVPHVVEQIIRPTGIVDPNIEIRPTQNQVKDVMEEIKKRIAKKERSLVMALTKRLAEDISVYLKEAGINAEYLHSEVKTMERTKLLNQLRAGDHDVLVGINLLREGIDLPEVSFIAILDADKEGFLRNQTTLLQIIGRAARHTDGTVILYADRMTDSMKIAIKETDRRRAAQTEYNHTHGITPTQIIKEIRSTLFDEPTQDLADRFSSDQPTVGVIKELQRELKKAVKEMNFERAAQLRDRIKKISEK
ncbi:MAG: excinuclease ABC subunit UvrB [bacterium]|nr:excinuclease ABC subunit UvrB [bacterium]MDZ4285613.1 excinuclease ABC subunit UvrB [Candidatus Sungbacteria bacterium]